jgi:hypothetical protein
MLRERSGANRKSASRAPGIPKKLGFGLGLTEQGVQRQDQDLSYEIP